MRDGFAVVEVANGTTSDEWMVPGFVTLGYSQELNDEEATLAQDSNHDDTQNHNGTLVPLDKVCNDDLECQMFDYWYNHGRNQCGTAKHFNVSRGTISRMSKRHNWVDRGLKIRGDTQKAADKKLVRRELSNVARARQCLSKEIKAYLNKDHVAVGDLRAIVVLMRYIDEIEGVLPTSDVTTNETYITYNFGKLTDDERDTQRRSIASAFQV